MRRPYLYLDSETLPTVDTALIAHLASKISAPGSMKKPETIAAWEANEKPAAVAEAIAKTSLDGAYGRLACVGFALNDEGAGVIQSCDSGSTEFDERTCLTAFFGCVDEQIRTEFRGIPPIIVGHNVIGFDLRFISQRAIVHGVRLPSWWPRDPKPWSEDVFDTMTAWAGARERIGFDNLARALSLPGKGEIDGSMVAGMWAEGRYDEVGDYCVDDVNKVRAVHRKMMLALGDGQ